MKYHQKSYPTVAVATIPDHAAQAPAIRYFLSFFLSLFILALLASCDPCKGVLCQNGGSCDDGSCICTPWIEGDRCEKEMRDKFLGTYKGTSTFDGRPWWLKSSTLEPVSGDILKISFDGFAIMVLTGPDTFDIPLQTINDPNFVPYTIQGSDKLEDRELTYTYVFTYVGTGSGATFSFTGIKQ